MKTKKCTQPNCYEGWIPIRFSASTLPSAFSHSQCLRRVASLSALMFVALFASATRAAPPTPQEIVRRALNISEGVNDYHVIMTLSVRGPNIRVPARRFELYYKKPDRLKVISDELIILPRDAVLFLHRLGDHVTEEADAQFVLASVRRQDGRTFYEVIVRPREGTPGLMPQVSVVVDGDRWTVERMVFSDGQRNTVEMQAEWVLVDDAFWLPRRVVFTARGSGRPPGGDPDQGYGEAEEFTATLTWSNYQVNIGLADDFFR